VVAKALPTHAAEFQERLRHSFVFNLVEHRRRQRSRLQSPQKALQPLAELLIAFTCHHRSERLEVRRRLRTEFRERYGGLYSHLRIGIIEHRSEVPNGFGRLQPRDAGRRHVPYGLMRVV
jgi:hypothetical protein